MKFLATIATLAAAATLSAGLGAIPLKAAGSAPAYVVIDISETLDPDAYIKAVKAAEPAASESLGGHFLIRSNSARPIDGGAAPARFVVIAFDSLEKAQAWQNLEAIRTVNAVRATTTRSRAFVVEGLAP